MCPSSATRPARPDPVRAVVRAVALVLVVVLVAGAAPGRAQAQATATAADAPPTVGPALADVAVASDQHRGLLAEHERLQAVRRQARADLARLAEQERILAAALARAGAVERLAVAEAAAWADRVEVLAVEAYIGAGGDDAVVAAGLDPAYTRGEQRTLLTAEVDDRWRRRLAAAEAVAADARADRVRLGEDHADVVAAQARTETRRREAAEEVRRLRPLVRAARATATVVGSDLTLVALDAYLRAALEVNAADPGCRLPWWLLAGIGRVESGHGTFADSELDAAGTARPAIVGIALDGSNGTAVIGDTDGGRLDGDAVSDRAVGPMQFIPSTWARYAVDGNGDGVADPQNVYDAARAAGDYLCTAASPLDVPANVDRAVHAYNHSDVYVRTVLGFATEYRAFRP